MDCSWPGSSVHGILQERILEWDATPSSRGSNRHLLCFLHWQAGSLPTEPPGKPGLDDRSTHPSCSGQVGRTSSLFPFYPLGKNIDIPLEAQIKKEKSRMKRKSSLSVLKKFFSLFSNFQITFSHVYIDGNAFKVLLKSIPGSFCFTVSAQSCLTLCDLMDCSSPGSSVHRIFQERILEWVAISSSRGSSWPRDQTRISLVSCSGRQILDHGATWVY